MPCIAPLPGAMPAAHHLHTQALMYGSDGTLQALAMQAYSALHHSFSACRTEQ